MRTGSRLLLVLALPLATATGLVTEINDNSGHPTIKRPLFGRFVVKNIYTDFKRHDLGPAFHDEQ